MANYTEAKQELVNYIYARTPLVIIDTDERERVERMLYEIVQQCPIDFLYYTEAKNIRKINSHGISSIDMQEDALAVFLDLIKKNRNLNIVLGDVRRISEDCSYSRDVMNLLYMAKENNAVVTLVTSDKILPRISAFGMSFKLDYPDNLERITLVKNFVKKYKSTFKIEWDEDDLVHVAAVLRGFSEIQIDNILASEIIGSRGLLKSKISQLSNKKQKLYTKTGSVQHINISKNYSVEGMGVLKRWLEAKRKIFFMPEETLQEYDLKAPKGILLVGVPGCGKSLTAKLVAQQWNLPLFRFDIGSVFDKWVGESEKRMREALQFIENVSPCILWIDEIEKVLATTDSGNETGKRVLGEFLFWIQEASAKVFMVATANNVEILPYELYRKGRFSEVFYAGLPNPLERKHTIQYYAHASLKIKFEDQFLEVLVKETEGFSYSDIETAIKELAQSMLISQEKSVTKEQILNVIHSVIPISQTNPELVKAISDWGTERAINVSDM